MNDVIILIIFAFIGLCWVSFLISIKLKSLNKNKAQTRRFLAHFWLTSISGLAILVGTAKLIDFDWHNINTSNILPVVIGLGAVAYLLIRLLNKLGREFGGEDERRQK